MGTPFAGNVDVPDPDNAQRRPTHRLVTQTRPSAGRIVAVSPFRCRLWELHDRLQDYVTEESCKAEIESFTTHRQLIPVLGRPLREDPDYDVELVYGARRLFVARHLGVPLQVELRDVGDREAIIAMDTENRHRKDISAYERGLSYRRWLRARHFESQDDIARALNISASQVSRLLKMAELPSVIVNAFVSPLDIRESWGLDLHRLWSNVSIRTAVGQRARALAERVPRLPAHDVYQRLLGPPDTTARSRRKYRDEVVLSARGTPLFRIRYQRTAVAVLLPAEAVSGNSLEQIRSVLAGILEPKLT
jgi:ParB family chromosome partitioning protein